LAAQRRLRKTYPEFWINLRVAMMPIDGDSGSHVAVRAPTRKRSMPSMRLRWRAGGQSDGTPGRRPEYSPVYYAAFIRDPDGNRIEAVTFLKDG